MTDGWGWRGDEQITEPGWYGPGRYVTEEAAGQPGPGPAPGPPGWQPGSADGLWGRPGPAGGLWGRPGPADGLWGRPGPPPGWGPGYAGARPAPTPPGYGYGHGYAYGHGYSQGYPYPLAPWRRTEGMAVAALVLGVASLLLGWFTFVVPLLAVVFGILALSRIRHSGTHLDGSGMAVAGIVLGSIGLVAAVAFWGSLAAGSA